MNTNTALPGITREMATVLAEGPDGLEFDDLLNCVGELIYEASHGSPNGPRANQALTVISKTIQRAKAVSVIARRAGQVMLDMTDAEQAMAAADSAGQIAEMVAGYRAKLEASGFSPTAAESMAMQLHAMMMMKAAGAAA